MRKRKITTPADREKMPLKTNFYHAHVTMMDSELRKYIEAVSRFVQTPRPYAENATAYTLHGGLINLLRDGLGSRLLEISPVPLVACPGSQPG
jgi:hypothetical protein